MFATDQEAREELQERTRSAWETYSERLQDLAGREYEEAEVEAWLHLQEQLSAIEDELAELAEAHLQRVDHGD